MSVLLLLARLVLVVVFIVAGVGKLFDLKGSQQAMRDFGLPNLLAAPLGVLLPFAELAVAVALVVSASAWWGAIGAAILLLLFVAGIGYNLTSGRRPDCHCFGVFYSSTISSATLIRNVILAVVAGIVIALGRVDAGPGMVAWIGALSIAQDIELVVAIIFAILLLAEGWVLVEAVRSIGRILGRLDALETRLEQVPEMSSEKPGLEVDSDAPTFELPDLDGNLVSLESLCARGKPVLLVFISPTCGPCSAMLPDLAEWQSKHTDRLTFAVISQGSAEDNRAKIGNYDIHPVLLQKDAEVAQAYLIRGTPTGVIVKADGGISSPLAEGEDEIRELVEEATVILPSRPGQLPILHPTIPNTSAPEPPKVGELAPDITMPDLDGNLINLGDFLGKPTLVLFWSTSCGYCQAMLRDLKAWEAKPPKDAPQLLVISSGNPKENRAQGIRAPIMLDDSHYAQRMFGVNGTPIAVLLDENGYVISEPAVGANEVLALAKKPIRSKAKPKPAAV
ncbi:MAG TPA: redoxin domain-containing protein [Ktedonobacteraceae bacterium]|nr:redoxin domain-containing protein [Ktedonobacteraceae bacterium]